MPNCSKPARTAASAPQLVENSSNFTSKFWLKSKQDRTGSNKPNAQPPQSGPTKTPRNYPTLSTQNARSPVKAKEIWPPTPVPEKFRRKLSTHPCRHARAPKTPGGWHKQALESCLQGERLPAMPNRPRPTRTAASVPQPVRRSSYHTGQRRPQSNKTEPFDHPGTSTQTDKNPSKLSNTIHSKRTISCKSKGNMAADSSPGKIPPKTIHPPRSPRTRAKDARRMA